jgi:GNAT superfamily N-acetyltransferase
MNVRFSRATVQEISAARTIDLREKVMWPGQRGKCILAEDNDENALHLGAFLFDEQGEGGDPVGVISAFVTGGTEQGCLNSSVQFRKFAVDTSLQGSGIGSTMMRSLLGMCRDETGKMKCSRVWCDAREEQQGFYERFGMQRVGDPYVKYAGADKTYVKMEITLALQGVSSQNRREGEK